jgi:hypothetical protein
MPVPDPTATQVHVLQPSREGKIAPTGCSTPRYVQVAAPPSRWHEPMTHAAISPVGAMHVRAQAPQSVAELMISVSQPFAGSPSQSAVPSTQRMEPL